LRSSFHRPATRLFGAKHLLGSNTGNRKALTANDAKYGFGGLIDLARAKPVAVAKHGRPVVVVMAVENFERLKALESPATRPGGEAEGEHMSRSRPGSV
jgi:prevent-host-death family protein